MFRKFAVALSVCWLLTLAGPGSAAAQDAKYHEAPALAELVKAGKLPPVEQRLPEQPLVVPVVEKTGEYGGVWRRAFLGPADANNYVRVVYDGLFRFSPDGARIEPKLAQAATSSPDFKVWTIQLRKGARWSDGTPFTADDIIFWYKDVITNRDLTPSLPTWMSNSDGSAAKVEKIDDVTVRFTYDRPATLFLSELANQDGPDQSFAMFLPAHYLKQFHPAYTKMEDLDRQVQAASFKSWTQLFTAKATPASNPERPTMAAWLPVSRISDPVFTIRRNPYYIGVDPAGNQLPYIDEVRFTYFADQQALNLAAIAGDFDMQARHIQMTNYPVLKEQEKNGKYRVLIWPTFGGSDAIVAINSTYTADPVLGRLLATKDFRVALSYAINRDEIKEFGVSGSRRGTPAGSGAWASVLSRQGVGDKIYRVQSRSGEQDARCSGLGEARRRGRAADGERQAADGRDQRRAGVRCLAGCWAANSPGLAGGWYQGRGTDPRARARVDHARRQSAADRDLE